MWLRVGYTSKIWQKHPKIAFLAVLNQNFCTKNLTQEANFFCGHCPYHGLMWNKKFWHRDVIKSGLHPWNTAKYTQKWHFLRFFGILFFCRLKISKILVDYAAGTCSAPICDNFGVTFFISIKHHLFFTLVVDR